MGKVWVGRYPLSGKPGKDRLSWCSREAKAPLRAISLEEEVALDNEVSQAGNEENFYDVL